MHAKLVSVLAVGALVANVYGAPVAKPQFSVGDPSDTLPGLSNPSTVVTWGGKEKKDVVPNPPNSIQLGDPTTTITWGDSEKRDAEAKEGDPPNTITWGEPTTTVTWGNTEKRDASAEAKNDDIIELGDASSTTTWY